MNIMKKIAGIALLLVMFNVAGAAYAKASVIDDVWNWINPGVDASTNAADSSRDSSFADSVSQTILSIATQNPTIQPNAVAPVTNPATSTAKAKAVPKTVRVMVTGYSSTPDQTDSSPFITASGTYVRDGIVAANFLPIGKAIKIPKLFGDKVFIVEDRMNRRYWYSVDIWFSSRDLAKTFGAKVVDIEIVS